MIACIAIGALVHKRSRLWLAGLFGLADGVAFLIGAGLGWRLAAGLTAGLEIGLLVALGLYLLVVAGGTQRVAAVWPVWVVPFALAFDNLAYGVVEHGSGPLLGQAGVQALSSSLLAFVGLLVAAAALPMLRRRVAVGRVAGGALLVATGGLVLLG